MRRVIAVIGTAGRDKQFPMDLSHWKYMCNVLRFLVGPEDHLVSGGAAWADHAAVWAYMEGLCEDLTLHLPAPFDGVFHGGYGTSGGAANYYHEKFSQAIGQNTRGQIYEALSGGAQCTGQPVAQGYGAMFTRNKLVADQCTHLLAFTFGDGDTPADGGTKATWDMAGPTKKRRHISLLDL